jgi:release factor glutamine methyltransferase
VTTTTAPTSVALERSVGHEVGSTQEGRWIVHEAWLRVTGGPPADRRAVPPQEVVGQARAMARRRRDGEPLQYVFGHWPFRQLDLEVDRRVLIPRPETEGLVDLVREGLGRREQAVAADLGTGSGALALALADELRSELAEVVAVDVDPSALAVARSNYRRLVAQRRRQGALSPRPVRFREGWWWSAVPARLKGRLAAVVANPPYVAEAEWHGLDPSVRCFEPRRALLAGSGPEGTPGLADVATIVAGSRAFLGRPGVAVVELAPAQAQAAADLARRAGFDHVEVRADLAGRQRALVATLRP